MTKKTYPTGLVAEWPKGDSTWKPDMDKNIRLLDACSGIAVVSGVLTAPPSSPSEGDTYMVSGTTQATATGLWTGQDGKIARWNSANTQDVTVAKWEFFTPKLGWIIIDGENVYQWGQAGAYRTLLPVKVTNLSTSTLTASTEVQTPILRMNSIVRIDEDGDAFLKSVTAANLTAGKIPLAGVSGLIGDSSLSEDSTKITSPKPIAFTSLTPNKLIKLDANKKTVDSCFGDDEATATISRQKVNIGTATAGSKAWWSEYHSVSEIGSGAYLVGGAGSLRNRLSHYYDGTASKALGDGRYPTAMSFDSGQLVYRSSLSNTWAADATITDLTPRWSVDRFGLQTQCGSELVTSACYIKATNTTIGPSAAAKASLLNGDTVIFAAVSDPVNRWNVIGAKSKTEMMGIVSSAANQILTFELYLNGASAVTLTTPARTFGTNTPWRLVIKQTTLVAGTSGTVRVMMRFYCTADNANATSSCYATEVALGGIDLASAQTWDVVCTIPNNASNRITCQDVEKIG